MKRYCDEPKLAIGDAVEITEGVTGVVLARYTPSAHKDEVRYIVAVATQKPSKRPR